MNCSKCNVIWCMAFIFRPVIWTKLGTELNWFTGECYYIYVVYPNYCSVIQCDIKQYFLIAYKYIIITMQLIILMFPDWNLLQYVQNYWSNINIPHYAKLHIIITKIFLCENFRCHATFLHYNIFKVCELLRLNKLYWCNGSKRQF